MTGRICPACRYNVVSTVVAACPNCGTTLPATLTSSSSSLMVAGAVLILVAGAAGWFLMGGSTAVNAPSVAPRSTAPPATVRARPASPRAATASPVSPAASPRTATAAVDERNVEALVAKLAAPATAWEAAAALADIPSPRAERALMAAYDRREYGKMAGAAAFYARKRPPAYEKVLVDLLNQSRDLAVAQDLILAKDPKISEPARKWAAEQGFKLVPSKKTPTGVTWVSVSQ
jgi:hypothetical protein